MIDDCCVLSGLYQTSACRFWILNCAFSIPRCLRRIPSMLLMHESQSIDGSVMAVIIAFGLTVAGHLGSKALDTADDSEGNVRASNKAPVAIHNIMPIDLRLPFGLASAAASGGRFFWL